MTSQTSPPDYTHEVYLTHQGRLTLTERAEHLRYEVIPLLVGERVSSLSPLGQALLGRRIGDEVDVPAPGGHYRCVIKSATRTAPTPKSRRGSSRPTTSKQRPPT